MFSCVWLHFKKNFEKYFLVFGKEEGKDKPRKTRTKPRKNPKKKIINNRRLTGFDGAVLRKLQSDDRAVNRDQQRNLTKARSRSLRDHNRHRDLAKRRTRSRIAVIELELASSTRTGARGSPAIIGLDWSSVFFLSRAHSLSLFFRKYFEVKMKV